MPSSRAAQSEATRRRLLTLARAMLLERGFEDTQLRDLAAQAGVALGTVYVHFADKHALLCAALFDDLEAAAQEAAAVPEDELLPWLDRVTDTLLRAYTRQPTVARALLREALLAESPWKERFAGLIAQLAERVERRVLGEQDAGRLHPKASARVFAGAWVAFVNFALLAWVQGSHPEPRRLVAVMVQQQVQGMSP